MTVYLKTPRNFSIPLKHHKNISCCIAAIFLIDLPLSFHYVLGVYLFIVHFAKLSLMPGIIPTLNYQKNVLFILLGIYTPCLLWSSVKIINCFQRLNLLFYFDLYRYENINVTTYSTTFCCQCYQFSNEFCKYVAIYLNIQSRK